MTNIYSFAPFGYDGAIVQVETDLRGGIPSYDIVGIADSAVKETREKIRTAFTNSGLDFPTERVLQSLSPADLRKDSPMDLSMALGILEQTKQYPLKESVLALGELELSGRIRPVRGSVAAVYSAKTEGITNIVCDPTTAEFLKDIDGIKILTAESLKEANEKLMDAENFQKTEPKIQFNEVKFTDYEKPSFDLKGYSKVVRAISIAIAGKLNILAYGAPGCGKTTLFQSLIPYLTPCLTVEELESVKRLYSLAGMEYNTDNAPFRMPHQTASIEGICGGGPNCRPGEISLAHNGTLFFDEAAEFRTSVLQMLRVPIETKHITLSRAGRSTIFPANFQLAMAVNPCPCGNYGEKDKICLCSAKSIEMYWKKFSAPLLDRIQIKIHVEKDESKNESVSLENVKEQIKNAYRIQRENGCYNKDIPASKLDEYTTKNTWINDKSKDLSERAKHNVIKTAITIANMDNRTEINESDWNEAYKLQSFSEIQFI